jgi:hypothetical protein
VVAGERNAFRDAVQWRVCGRAGAQRVALSRWDGPVTAALKPLGPQCSGTPLMSLNSLWGPTSGLYNFALLCSAHPHGCTVPVHRIGFFRNSGSAAVQVRLYVLWLRLFKP